jgi:hypothetical protein
MIRAMRPTRLFSGGAGGAAPQEREDLWYGDCDAGGMDTPERYSTPTRAMRSPERSRKRAAWADGILPDLGSRYGAFEWRPEHRLWPQPTRTGTQAVLINRPQPADPQCNGIAFRRPSRAWNWRAAAKFAAHRESRDRGASGTDSPSIGGYVAPAVRLAAGELDRS